MPVTASTHSPQHSDAQAVCSAHGKASYLLQYTIIAVVQPEERSGSPVRRKEAARRARGPPGLFDPIKRDAASLSRGNRR